MAKIENIMYEEVEKRDEEEILAGHFRVAEILRHIHLIVYGIFESLYIHT